jgi:hypothetical protein
MKTFKTITAALMLALSLIALTPKTANATVWAGDKFIKVLYFCGTTVGTGKATGTDPSNCLPIKDETIFTTEAKMLITNMYMVITTTLTGTTDIDIGVTADDADGFFDGSLALTALTPGVYGWDAKLKGAYLRVQTAGVTDAADIYVVPQAKYYTAATAIAMDVTTANTAGAFQVVIEGVKFK